MRKIKHNDLVQVTAGRDKGKKGKVLRLSYESNRAIVEGINLVKKHQRRTQQDQQAKIIVIPSAVHISNLLLMCKNCNRPTRVGVSVIKDGTKSRICKKCKQVI